MTLCVTGHAVEVGSFVFAAVSYFTSAYTQLCFSVSGGGVRKVS